MKGSKKHKNISEDSAIIALAGNPNVGKSTLFNQLTGMKQHTGNWTGKTVATAKGYFSHKSKDYVLMDLPGTYSLMSNSSEEEIARDFICFGQIDKTIVICDATALEHNLNLLLQILEISKQVVLCVNLMDEAKKKGISVDCKKLSQILGIPVFPISARQGKGIEPMLDSLEKKTDEKKVIITGYHSAIEEAIELLSFTIEERFSEIKIPARWLAIKLLEGDEKLSNTFKSVFDFKLEDDSEISEGLVRARKILDRENINSEVFRDMLVSALILQSEYIYQEVVTCTKSNYNEKDRKADKLLTGKYTGIPCMIILLLLIFWITIIGANYPSALISDLLFSFQNPIYDFFGRIGFPVWLNDMLVLGVYRVLAWVVSVMLPPMAIFFPLFTLLEDLGYLPRVAFNMDKSFRRCHACGKQALTMSMGFGCNAVGVMGCRIIDSPRERLIAIITNSFVPCNGRFPTLIAIISMFFVSSVISLNSLLSALILALAVIMGIVFTFISSKLLSKTVLKGYPSSFVLELPPYRRPQIFKVIVRSIFDRTLFVLGRAVIVAAPAGLVIWIMANAEINNISLLSYCTDFLNPFAQLFGLDGTILMAFILGFPANEIVLPIIIMTYMSSGSIVGFENLTELKTLLLNNGWTSVTAICVMLFSLMHWPCSTTCISIKKETGSFKWTLLSAALPTVFGLATCFVTATVAKLLGFE